MPHQLSASLGKQFLNNVMKYNINVSVSNPRYEKNCQAEGYLSSQRTNFKDDPDIGSVNGLIHNHPTNC